MIQHQGVYLPDGEVHLVDWMTKNGQIVDGRGSYQIRKLRASTSHCREFRTAVDIGAHVGLWSMQLVKLFRSVASFEPVPAHRECFRHNMKAELDSGRCVLFPCALGEKDGKVAIESTPGSSGDSRVNGEGDIVLAMLDDFQLANVDFMKLDCEGYELFALRGAMQTIKRWRPVVIVEQKPGRAQRFGLPERGAVDFMRGLGYTQVLELSGDFVLVP